MPPQVEDVPYYVYILANRKNGTLYIGLTNDLVRRVHDHKQGAIEGFTRKYQVNRLVFFETFEYGLAAFQRERTMKHWRRDWKIALIERTNPDWCDLYDGIAS
jgi:putative endonuclease